VVLASIALLALAWPGWLQGVFRHGRGLGWEVRVNPSLRRAAETLCRWREEGKLSPDARTFATHPDVAHYCAWFCPGEKCFLDSRLSLFVPVVPEYLGVCDRLDPTLKKGWDRVGTWPGDWQKPLTACRVACVVLYDPDLPRLAPALAAVSNSPDLWEVLRIDGGAVVVGWKGADPGQLRVVPLDPDRLAFGASDDALPPAPESGPETLARPLPWWERYLRRPGGSTWEAAAAAVYVRLFENGAGQQLERQRLRVWARFVGGLAPLPAGGGPSLLPLGFRVALQRAFIPDLRARPPALLLLGIRAGRRAVAEHPDDANVWLVLASAYLNLSQVTPEAVGVQMSPLEDVRSIQVITALTQAVRLNPDLAPGHQGLAQLYTERRFLDLALKHRESYLELVRRGGARPGEESDAFAARIKRLTVSLGELRTEVQTRESRYLVHSEALAGDPLARARLAVDLGLAGKALDEVLLKSHSDLYGIEGLRLLLELLLRTGRAEDVRELLDRPNLQSKPGALGIYFLPTNQQGRRWGYLFPAYAWFDICQSAAVGDYARAGDSIDRLVDRLGAEHKRADSLKPDLAMRVTASVGLEALPRVQILRMYNQQEQERPAHQINQAQLIPVEQGDLSAVRAMLLLEQGRPDEARTWFRRARAHYRDAPATGLAVPGLYLTRSYLAKLAGKAGG
jgi:hypothetical protein